MSVDLSKCKKIVIKVGSSTLTGNAGANLDPQAIDQLSDDEIEMQWEYNVANPRNPRIDEDVK